MTVKTQKTVKKLVLYISGLLQAPDTRRLWLTELISYYIPFGTEQTFTTDCQ